MDDKTYCTPQAFFITFTCYGSWLPGSEKGQQILSPYILDRHRRKTVLLAIQEVCQLRQWTLIAAHIRTNHVHIVVAAPTTPDKVLLDFKRRATQRLNQHAFDGRDRRRWTHHGSARYLWQPKNVTTAVQYVLEQQGRPMEIFENKDYLPEPQERPVTDII